MIPLIIGYLMASLSSLPDSSLEKLQFVDCHASILDQPCRALTLEDLNDRKMQQLFDSMLHLARGEQGDPKKHILVGLAAPQVGLDLRVILVDVKADGKGSVADLRVYINPEVVEFSEETESWYEGCYSTGNVKGVVTRPRRIMVRALDRFGNEVTETHSGYVARIFQHEIDHLDGIRFPTRMSEDAMLHLVKAEEMYIYRNQGRWRTWDVTIPQPEWKNHME